MHEYAPASASLKFFIFNNIFDLYGDSFSSRISNFLLQKEKKEKSEKKGHHHHDHVEYNNMLYVVRKRFYVIIVKIMRVHGICISPRMLDAEQTTRHINAK